MKAMLCGLRNLNLNFGNKIIFKQASIFLNQGDKIGLLGLNGQGKSTLLKIIHGQVQPDISQPPFELIIPKTNKSGKGGEGTQFSTFLVPQEIILPEEGKITLEDYFFMYYPEHLALNRELESVENQLSLSADFSEEKLEKLLHKQDQLMQEMDHLGTHELQSAYQSYLSGFGLKDRTLFVNDLSGGEQKKVLLSLGLSSRANLILWDEPTNHLDMDTIKDFEEELRQSKSSLIIISHDRYLLSKVTDKIWHIRQGLIEDFNGSYVAYLAFLAEQRREMEVMLSKLKNGLKRETGWMRQGIKARGTRSKKRVENFHALHSRMKDLKSKMHKEMSLTVSDTARKSKKLLEFIEVACSYGGRPALFSGLNFSVHKGDKIGLIGRNGVGKSSLIHLMTGDVQASQGEVKRLDSLKVKLFSQKRVELESAMTPYDFLAEGQDFIHLPDGSKRHVSDYFESFLFHRDDLRRPLDTFSGGERNRLQLAYNLKQEGDLLIFDEPTNDLDLETLTLLEDKLAQFTGSLIIISHDRAFLSAVTNKVWLLEDRKLQVFNGGYSQVEEYIELLAEERLLEIEEREEKEEKEAELAKQKAIGGKAGNAAPQLSNKDKTRLKEIKNEIGKQEKQLEKLDAKMADFDFATSSAEKQREYGKWSSEKEGIEAKLLELYEESEGFGA